MVKFSSPDDEGYQRLSHALSIMHSEAPDSIKSNWTYEHVRRNNECKPSQ